MLLLTYTPVQQHTFRQDRRGFPEHDAQGNFVGVRPECGRCLGYGTEYQMRFGDGPDSVFGIETGYFDCPQCKGSMWAPYVFKEIR